MADYTIKETIVQCHYDGEAALNRILEGGAAGGSSSSSRSYSSVVAGPKHSLNPLAPEFYPKRIARATSATFVTSLANIEGEESFEACQDGPVSGRKQPEELTNLFQLRLWWKVSESYTKSEKVRKLENCHFVENFLLCIALFFSKPLLAFLHPQLGRT